MIRQLCWRQQTLYSEDVHLQLATWTLNRTERLIAAIARTHYRCVFKNLALTSQKFLQLTLRLLLLHIAAFHSITSYIRQIILLRKIDCAALNDYACHILHVRPHVITNADLYNHMALRQNAKYNQFSLSKYQRLLNNVRSLKQVTCKWITSRRRLRDRRPKRLIDPRNGRIVDPQSQPQDLCPPRVYRYLFVPHLPRARPILIVRRIASYASATIVPEYARAISRDMIHTKGPPPRRRATPKSESERDPLSGSGRAPEKDR